MTWLKQTWDHLILICFCFVIFIIQDLSALAKLQQQNIMEKKFGKNENVAVVVTTADVSTKGDDDELVEALENKFDALRDKVLAEALMKQVR